MRFTSLGRREFLIWLARISSLGVIGWFAFSGLQRKKKLTTVVEKVLPPETNGIALYKKTILIKNGEQITAFSRKCTHLGCDLILNAEGNLSCPCHGSSFQMDGAPLFGPAKVPLVKLSVREESASGLLILEQNI